MVLGIFFQMAFARFTPNANLSMRLLLATVLLLFGAKKLPELARGLGKSMGEFKKARQEFEDEITRAQEDIDISDDASNKRS